MDAITRVLTALLVLNLSTASEFFDLPCSSDPECANVQGALCDTNLGTCYCPGYYVLDSFMTRCLPVLPGAGSECEQDAQCSASMLVGGACVDGQCACIEGMHYHKGRCWQTKQLGDECTYSEQCVALHAPNALECQDGHCACASGFYQREYSDCRPIVTEVGGGCGLDFDCHINDSYCSKDLACTCISGPSEPGATSCDPAPEDVKIEVLSTRNSNIRALGSAYMSTKSSKEFGKECVNVEDCGMSNAQCTLSGYCACEKGFFMLDDNQCVAEIGSPCVDNADCKVVNSTCTNNMCTCHVGHGASSTRQHCIQQLFDYKRTCTEASMCMLFGGRSICKPQGSVSVCDCDPSSRLISDQHICWIIKGPGQSCSDPQDCYVTDKNQPISCNSGMCECFDGFHPSQDGTNCHLDAPDLGDKCTEDMDCEVQNAMCSSSKCACKSGYVMENGACVIGVGASCTETADCAIVPNAECKSSKCACVAGFISSIDITACLPVGEGMGSQCSEMQQCTGALGEFADCVDDQCACAKKHHLALGECVPSKGLGESCERSVDCNLALGNEGVVCRNYQCTCDYGFHPDQYNSVCNGSGKLVQSTSLLIVALLCSIVKYISYQM